MTNAVTARQILEEIQYATIATSGSAGSPWNTPVFCAFDDSFNIYWSSTSQSVHSQNIAENSRVFIVIYNSKAGEGDGTGLYFQGTATELDTKAEISEALVLLGDRRGKPFKHIDKYMGGGPQRIYKAAPDKIWLNDAERDADGDFIHDFRVEVILGSE